MAFSGEETGGGIEADPACARQVDFGPRVKIGEVRCRSFGPLERFKVGLELDEIAGDEASRQSKVAENLRQQPSAVD